MNKLTDKSVLEKYLEDYKACLRTRWRGLAAGCIEACCRLHLALGPEFGHRWIASVVDPLVPHLDCSFGSYLRKIILPLELVYLL